MSERKGFYEHMGEAIAAGFAAGWAAGLEEGSAMSDQLPLFNVRGRKESCKSCRWFVEIIGLGRPHPLRCRFAHAHRQLDHLQELPDECWCLHYEEER